MAEQKPVEKTEVTSSSADSTKAPSRGMRSNGFASRLLIGLLSATCIVFFQNCGTDFVPLSEDQLASMGTFVCGSSLEEAFGRSYHPFMKTTCAACHGATQSPKFALSDRSLAYPEFNNTTQEKIFTYATNPSHGGGAGGPKNLDVISRAQANFNSCKGGGGSGTTGVVTARTQPLTLAATATLALKSFTSLDTQLELGSKNLGGARLHFQVRVDMTTAVPAYIIAKPSLQTGTSTVVVKAISIRINGVKISTATAFHSVDRVINPNTNPLNGQNPNGNLSAGSAIFEYAGANPATDTIQFEFETLAVQ